MLDSLNCVFEYPNHDLTLLYSGNLASSRGRGRVFMGHDAFIELGNNAIITADRNSTRYAEGIKSGVIDPGSSMISFNPGAGQIDAVTSYPFGELELSYLKFYAIFGRVFGWVSACIAG